MNAVGLPLHSIPSPVRRLFLAFSAGIDSVALAHCLLGESGLPEPLLWHVNHGLQFNADEMEAFATEWASRQGLAIRTDRLQLDGQRGNLEARARKARYSLFAAALQPGDVLLTAHHANDQAETLLLNLLRGSGPAGLRGVAHCKTLGQGLLSRPLLAATRGQILAYARHHELTWIEDPSNDQLHFDRNFLRQRVLPDLEGRWPSLVQSFGHACEWQKEAHDLLGELAREDLDRAAESMPFTPYLALDCVKLAGFSPARGRNLVRHWLESNGQRPPGRKKLAELLHQLQVRADASPRIDGEGYSLRIYRGHLYLVDQEEEPRLQSEYRFDGYAPLTIAELGFRESRNEVLARFGIGDNDAQLSLRFRHDKPTQSAHSHRLKRLFQKHRVPSWLRASTPQVYLGDELIGLWLTDQA